MTCRGMATMFFFLLDYDKAEVRNKNNLGA